MLQLIHPTRLQLTTTAIFISAWLAPGCLDASLVRTPAPGLPPAPAHACYACPSAPRLLLCLLDIRDSARSSVVLLLPRQDGGKRREGRERRGEGEARCARKSRGRRRSPAAGCCLPPTGAIAACATPDLLFKHTNEIFTRQMKH